MYVTSGQYKGKRVLTPDGVKPTLSKVRQSVFNVLNSIFLDKENLLFLDMFAGSAIMSLEALSRGYKTITIDKDKNSIRIIKANLKDALKNCEIICADSVKFIENLNKTPDVIYIDPPWDFDYYPIIKKVLTKFKGSIAIVEYDKKRAQEFCEIYSKTIAPFKEKVYGRCKIDFLKTS